MNYVKWKVWIFFGMTPATKEQKNECEEDLLMFANNERELFVLYIN